LKKYGSHLIFLPNSESDNFLEEVKGIREISKDLPYDLGSNGR
jgi:hypothetical protein